MGFLRALLRSASEIRFWDIAVGIPAGLVIFMLTFLIVRLYENQFSQTLAFFLLTTVVCWGVGSLIGMVRFSKSQATALVAGICGAALLAWLWVTVFSHQPSQILVAVPGLLLVVVTPWAAAKPKPSNKGLS